MGWQGRDSRRYFYLARRRNGRQENVYFGKGLVAELAAAKLEERSKSRRLLEAKLMGQLEVRP